MTVAFLNGKFYSDAGTSDSPGVSLGGTDMLPLSQALISVFDAGLQHGVGLFETMLGGVQIHPIEGATSHGEELDGWVIQLDEHLERLAGSARDLGLSDQLRTGALAEAVMETVRRSRLPKARIRLTITGGDLSMLAAAQAGGTARRSLDPTVLIVAQPATEYPSAMFDRGVRVVLASARANPLDQFQGHKTLNYWWRLRELQLAAQKGAGEAVVLSVSNHVCGGCVSNILLVRRDELITPIARGEETGTPHEQPVGSPKPAHGIPGLPSPVLPGITRSWTLGKLEQWGLSIRKRMVSVQDVLDADEVMLTNSSWGVLPVVKLEANDVADGKPGRWTRDLRDAWLELSPRETDE